MDENGPHNSEPSSKKRFSINSPHKEIDSRWVELKFSHSFSPRSYFASCIQAGNIYIHGGFSAETGIMKDLLVCCMYDMPATWKPIVPKNIKTCNPGPLRNHTLSSYLSNLILIGGQKNVVESNSLIYRYDLLSNSWSICKCVNQQGKPFNLALDSHSTIVHKNCLYIIGGYDAKSTLYSNQIIKISLERIAEDNLTYQIINPQVSPSSRTNATCCLVQNEIYLFGGGKVEEVYSDLWIWNIQSQTWAEVAKTQENITWPERRKGATLVFHEKSNTLFLFGGIKTITKECNDVLVWMISKKRWIKIHTNTNQIYDPSPIVKEQIESPFISEQRRKKQKMRSVTGGGCFKIGLNPVAKSDSFHRMNETGLEFLRKQHSSTKVEVHETVIDFKRKMSVVQEKKYRQFLARKKKLLSNIESGFDRTKQKKSHSPTSQAIIFSLNTMGEQPRNQKSDILVPKVIYDQDKGHVIGKKPCARDGHAALVHEEYMIILGGDRHMVSFKDAYLFKLNKGVESLPHYQ